MLEKTLSGGVKMPVIGFGTYKLADPAECKNTVFTALKEGYRLIDTAKAYGNEEAVGAGIKEAINAGIIKREDVFITTKIWYLSFETDDCIKSIEDSFEKLGVNYIDMVLLHWPFGNVYAAWRVLEDYYKNGRIRAIGVSNMEADRLIDLIAFNEVRPAVNQIETHLYCQRSGEKEWLNKYGIAHQAYSPLGHGSANEMFKEKAVEELAAKYGKTPAQILLRFLVQSDVSVIPKTAREERLKENISIFDFKLSENEMNILKALDRKTPIIGKAENPEKVESALGLK